MHRANTCHGGDDSFSANLFAYPYIGAVSPYLSQTNFRGVLSVTLLIPRLSSQSPVYAVLDALARILLENVHIVIERLMENVHVMNFQDQ